MTVQYHAPIPRYCLYCNKCFPRDVDYLEHMNGVGVHSLPAWNINSENLKHSGILPTERAFGGTLKTYEIAVGANDLDLIHVLHKKRQEIKNILRLSVQQHSQKVQFSSKIRLTKPPKNDDEISSSQPERISVYLQSKMERVNFGGLTDNSLIEQMLLSLNNFASHGSGWTLD